MVGIVKNTPHNEALTPYPCRWLLNVGSKKHIVDIDIICIPAISSTSYISLTFCPKISLSFTSTSAFEYSLSAGITRIASTIATTNTLPYSI